MIARFSLLHWLVISLVLTVVGFLAAEWSESLRSWQTLGDLGVTPFWIAMSILLGWVLHMKFWICASLAGFAAAMSWRALRRPAASRAPVHAKTLPREFTDVHICAK